MQRVGGGICIYYLCICMCSIYYLCICMCIIYYLWICMCIIYYLWICMCICLRTCFTHVNFIINNRAGALCARGRQGGHEELFVRHARVQVWHQRQDCHGRQERSAFASFYLFLPFLNHFTFFFYLFLIILPYLNHFTFS